MKKNRLTAIAGACAAVLIALGGCSGTNNASSGADTDKIDANTEATLTFAYWDENQSPAIKDHIAEFNKEFPKVKIETSITPWSQYWTKLRTQAEGKNLPDIFWMNGPNINLYASNGQLEPIDSIIESKSVDLKNYPQALVDLYTVDGKHYGIPKDFDTIGVWYNKKIFIEAGVPFPADDWTWADFQTAAKTISDKLKDKGIYGVATQLDGGQEGYYNTILQAGGSIVADGKSGYSDPKSAAGIKFWNDLIADGSSPSLQAMADTKPNVMFESGKSAMFWSGTWIVSELAEKMAANKDDIDLAPLPKGEQKASVIHGLTTVVAANSKNKAAAKAFIAYLASEKAQAKEAELGTANPAFTGTQKKFEESQPQWKLSVFADAAENYAFPYPVSKNTAAWNELENSLLPDAFSGKRPADEVCAELGKKMNEALQEEK